MKTFNSLISDKDLEDLIYIESKKGALKVKLTGNIEANLYKIYKEVSHACERQPRGDKKGSTFKPKCYIESENGYREEVETKDDIAKIYNLVNSTDLEMLILEYYCGYTKNNNITKENNTTRGNELTLISLKKETEAIKQDAHKTSDLEENHNTLKN